MEIRKSGTAPSTKPLSRTPRSSNRQGFRGLIAWQKADRLAHSVFKHMSKLPNQHRWLAGQATRAAISVPANIAEGYGRGSLGDYLRFLDIARGSLAELEYYLDFVEEESLLSAADANALKDLDREASLLLRALWRSLKQKVRTGDWNHDGGIRDSDLAYNIDSEHDEEVALGPSSSVPQFLSS